MSAEANERNMDRGTLLTMPDDIEKMWRLYDRACAEASPPTRSLKRSTFRLVAASPLFNTKKADSCADVQEVMYGYEARELLRALLKEMRGNAEFGGVGGFETYDELLGRFEWVYEFLLKGGFKRHAAEKGCSTALHCPYFLLSQPLVEAYDAGPCAHCDADGAAPPPVPEPWHEHDAICHYPGCERGGETLICCDDCNVVMHPKCMRSPSSVLASLHFPRADFFHPFSLTRNARRPRAAVRHEAVPGRVLPLHGVPGGHCQEEPQNGLRGLQRDPPCRT